MDRINEDRFISPEPDKDILCRKVMDYFESTPYCEMMKQCDHGNKFGSNPYHEEGDVWTHTKMVLDVLKTKNEFSQEVLAAVVLHDIAKPLVRTEKEGRTRFFGHPGRGFFESADVLRDMRSIIPEMKTLNVEETLKIIAMHDFFYMNPDKPFSFFAKAFDGPFYGEDFLKKLFLVSECDNEGRICAEEYSWSKENIKTFQEGVWEAFYSLREKKELLKEQIEQSERPEVVFLVGPPYSGKSTFIANSDYDSFTVISRDELIEKTIRGDYSYNEKWNMADQGEINSLLDKTFRNSIKNEENVVVDMVNMTKKARRGRLSLFKGYEKKAIVFIIGNEEMKRRSSLRKNKQIDPKTMNAMLNNFHIPDYSDFDHIETYNNQSD